MSVGHGLSRTGRNIGWGILRIRRWGRCLVLKRDDVKRKLGKTAFWKVLWPTILTRYFWVIKSQQSWRVECVARTGNRKDAYRVLVEEEERANWESTGVDEITMLKFIFKTWNGGPCTILILLRTGARLALLWIWEWTSGFRKMRGISWLAEDPLISQGGLFSLDVVTEHLQFILSSVSLKF